MERAPTHAITRGAPSRLHRQPAAAQFSPWAQVLIELAASARAWHWDNLRRRHRPSPPPPRPCQGDRRGAWRTCPWGHCRRVAQDQFRRKGEPRQRLDERRLARGTSRMTSSSTVITAFGTSGLRVPAFSCSSPSARLAAHWRSSYATAFAAALPSPPPSPQGSESFTIRSITRLALRRVPFKLPKAHAGARWAARCRPLPGGGLFGTSPPRPRPRTRLAELRSASALIEHVHSSGTLALTPISRRHLLDDRALVRRAPRSPTSSAAALRRSVTCPPAPTEITNGTRQTPASCGVCLRPAKWGRNNSVGAAPPRARRMARRADDLDGQPRRLVVCLPPRVSPRTRRAEGGGRTRARR